MLAALRDNATALTPDGGTPVTLAALLGQPPDTPPQQLLNGWIRALSEAVDALAAVANADTAQAPEEQPRTAQQSQGGVRLGYGYTHGVSGQGLDTFTPRPGSVASIQMGRRFDRGGMYG
ncbi:hypothetical protein EBN88_05465 [Streptomyces triticirhizae]|uniref:Uncharacterized protein n=1 Tax=Streptomyces triticirhizae TaxID=2483353 RepID=A0A3M2M635_9ACTN|nr:hypothetical protein EBN88_05465 [Streptomyces triticirhizae]